MKKILLSIVLFTSGFSFATEHILTPEEIQMNYAVTCGSFQEIETALNQKLTAQNKREAIETRKLTLDILVNGQAALDKQGKYSGMACFGIVAGKELIIKDGCLNLETGEKLIASTDSAAGLAVCQALVDSGDAMPGF